MQAPFYKLSLILLLFSVHLNAAMKATDLEQEKRLCQPDRDFSERLGPARDQDGTGWCYAFAAADLVSDRLHQKISAADLALADSEHFSIADVFPKTVNLVTGKPSLLSQRGGKVNSAIRYGQDKGFCKEEDFPSETQLERSYASDLDRIQLGLPDPMCNHPNSLPFNPFVKLNLADFKKIVDKLPDQDRIRALDEESCRNKIHPDQPFQIQNYGISNIPYRRAPDLFHLLDDQLTKNNPVSITFHGEVLFNQHDFGTSWDHSAVIVGRRLNEQSGHCEYEIRSSWGRGCSAYDPTLDCREGNVWIPKAALAGSLNDITYLE